VLRTERKPEGRSNDNKPSTNERDPEVPNVEEPANNKSRKIDESILMETGN
jgi:hypothetical protein